MHQWIQVAMAFALSAGAADATAQAHPSLDVALQLAQSHGYRAAQVQWERVAAEAGVIADERGEDDAIRFVLKSLGDGHSFYRPPSPPAATPANASAPTGRYVVPMSERKAAVDGVPVIEVHRWSASPEEDLLAAAALRSQVVDALAESGCGIVLDFSSNSGGNMWPMMIGLSPLFTEGVLGSFQTARGGVSTIEKRGQEIFLRGASHPLNRATARWPETNAQRIGLVIGQKSISSGEIVPIMFHGQANVRFFGQLTSGHSTTNSPYPLPNGGLAVITVGTTLDRNRMEFGGAVMPDVLTDRPIADAAHWIASECHVAEKVSPRWVLPFGERLGTGFGGESPSGLPLIGQRASLCRSGRRNPP